MNAKTTYSKPPALSLPPEPIPPNNDYLLPPKTPIKKHTNDHQHSFLADFSPLPFPPKIESRAFEPAFLSGNEMRYVETPLPKQNKESLVFEEQAGMGHAIDNRIIFESSDEDAQNGSSQLDSSSSLEEENSSEEHSPASQQQSQEESENERSPIEQEHLEGSGEVKMRRTTKARGNSSAVKESNGDRKVMCNCKKTKCLKLYCDCFRLNQTCDGCNCVGCHNLDIYYEERNNAIMALMDRNPDPFGQKIEDDKHVKGCNCKKSNCLKKYCECYQAGLKCGQNCKCEECKNVFFEKEGYEPEKGIGRNTAKKQRKMIEM